MTRIPIEDFEAVRAVPILAVARALGLEVKPSREGGIISCPASVHQHDPERPLCGLNEEKSVFGCLKCGESGDVIKLVRLSHECELQEAVGWLQETFHLSAGGNGRTAGPVDPIVDLAGARGWSAAALRSLGAEGRGDEVVFPMRDATGAVTGWRRRKGDGSKYDGGQKALTIKGGKNGLLCPWPLPDGVVLLVEGETDAAAALSAGWPCVVGTPGAGPGRAVEQVLQHVLAGRMVILAPDPDQAGDRWRERMARTLSGAKCQVKFIPPLDGLDLDARLRHETDKAAMLGQFIGEALPWVDPKDATPPRVAVAGPGQAGDDDLFRLTDLGNAERFARQHKGAVLFDARLGRWRFWSDKVWVLDETGEIMRRAHKTARSIYSEAADAKNSKLADALAAHAHRTQNRDRLRAMIDLAKSLEGLTLAPGEWDQAPWNFNVQNGTVDLKTGLLNPHDQKNHFTKIAPVDYVPDARHEILDKVLAEALPDTEAQHFFQKLLGYSLVGEKYEKVIGFVYGPTDTAKSTLCDAFLAALGDYATAVEPETLAPKTSNTTGGTNSEVASLAGIRFVLTSEVAEGQRLDVSLLKRMTGGEPIRARHPWGQSFLMRPIYLILIQSNFRPVVSDSDDAIWNRLRVVPFTNIIPEDRKDPAIKKTLECDPGARAALFAWAVRGCLLWQKEGLKIPEAVKVATGQYRQDMDPLMDFLADHCILGAEYQVSTKELRAAYADWARESGLKFTLTPKIFGEKLRAHGCVPERDFKGRFWRGIALTMTAHDGNDSSFISFSTCRDSKKKDTEVASLPSFIGLSAVMPDQNDPKNDAKNLLKNLAAQGKPVTLDDADRINVRYAVSDAEHAELTRLNGAIRELLIAERKKSDDLPF